VIKAFTLVISFLPCDISTPLLTSTPKKLYFLSIDISVGLSHMMSNRKLYFKKSIELKKYLKHGSAKNVAKIIE
jgi:hypothetical protein